MKYSFSVLILALSFSARAGLVHKDGQGNPPSEARAKMARECFNEAISSGCKSPREGRQEFRKCVRDSMETFSSECRAFITRKYGRKA